MENDKAAPKAGIGRSNSTHRRDDRPKVNPKEDLGYRITGLEDAKKEQGMTGADIAALDRAIAKLREKKAEKEKPKAPGQTEE